MVMLGDYRLDPPDDPPIETCRDCGGTGEGDATTVHPGGDGDPFEIAGPCRACAGEGERYLTDDELREDAADAAQDRAEARAEARGGW